jgi:hypothetical protein
MVKRTSSETYKEEKETWLTKAQHTTLGFAILGQKQYPSALVRYWASARAEVFQCSFLFLSSSSVFQLGSGSGRKNFKSPNIAKPYRYLQANRSDTLQTL